MKVKRLEIQGFKSFKDKTVIHFDDGVTGIVGPNGCGKSNIVDSFFWVMGEQSAKHLRGASSSDLIFSGSQKYSPGGLAEVTMVLSTGAPKESDLPEGTTLRDLPPHMRYQEISITRRLYRSGDSEYLINGQTCRLKDIHELFMDTGAGPKAYSIIEQGQISKIVASKPEDRRVLIEEAAGISKFKARKKESLRKIEATQHNLQRINDIIIEIERQLASLERQAGKARQYKKYKEELQETELLVGKKRLYDLKIKTTALAERLNELNVKELENRNNLTTAELRIENYKIQATEAERQAEDTLTALQAVQRELGGYQTKMEVTRRTIEQLHTTSESLESEQQTLQAKIAASEEEKAAVEQESAGIQELFQKADSILKEKQGELDAARSEAEAMGQALETEKRELMSSIGRQTEMSNQMHGLEARVDGLSVQINTLSGRISERQTDVEILTEKVSQQQETYETLRTSTEETRAKLSAQRSRLQTLDAELRDLKVNEAKARDERAKAESRQRALQQLVESNESFRADVRNILSDESFSKGLAGAFADTLEAHPGYEYALESALRDYIENLFVEDSARAQELVGLLKDRNMGRVTFWSIDLLKAAAQNAPAKPALDAALGARPLSEVIRLGHAASEWVLKLFDRYYVVETLADALKGYAQTAGSGISFVTREGDSVDGMGRISGGSTQSLESGILSRKAELQQISERLVELVANHETLSARLHAVETEIHECRESADTLSTELRELEIQATSAEKDWRSSSSQLDSASRELERQREEKEGFEAERASLWEKLDGIRNELVSAESTARSRQAEIDGKSAAYNAAMGRAAELQAALIQFKVDFAAANEKYRFAKEKLTTLDRDLKANRARLEEVQRLMNRKLDEKDNLQQELMVLEETVQTYIERAQNTEDRMRSQKEDLERARTQLSAAMEDQRVAMKAVEECASELNRLKLDQERSTLEYQALYQGLFERYGVEESAIVHQAEFDDLTPETEREMMAEVDRLRERIRKLGEVNVMAVEEYDEQKKRYDFLNTQKEDLLRSISDLEKAIERINKTSEERFLRAYEEINKRFTQIFPLVFGGGAARLELTNPEDLVETGVEIFAEPPGKKMGSIQLMSGGEKALTAVALIFSIFLIKPSPFCVLDEVDAPLDDHNVGKFNMLLKEMAQRSQFIIITHNKRTMELNNRLYGVTMEEPGVSKMVSIEMR